MLRGLNRWLEANRWGGDAVIATGLLAAAVLTTEIGLPTRRHRGYRGGSVACR